MTEPLSIRIDAEAKKRMDALSKRAKRSKPFLAAEAIAAYVESEEWQLGDSKLELRIWMPAEVSAMQKSRIGYPRGASGARPKRRDRLDLIAVAGENGQRSYRLRSPKSSSTDPPNPSYRRYR
jgi:predicted DNA-binding protein